MALTEVDLMWVRSQVGDTPDDQSLDDIHDRLLDRAATALEVLERRLANFLANPAQFVIPGEYGQNHAANIAALERKISKLKIIVATGGYGSRIVPMVRADAQR